MPLPEGLAQDDYNIFIQRADSSTPEGRNKVKMSVYFSYEVKEGVTIHEKIGETLDWADS
jgi:hypothetical protein